MSGFETVTLADVVLEKPAGAPIGEYVFELLPLAEYRVNKFTEKEELNMQVSIAEGEFAGKRVFWTYADPTTIGANGKPYTWSAQAMKRLQVVLGADALPGEDPKTTFNRIASSGNNRFAGSLVAETRKDKETGEYVPYIRPGATEPKAVFSIFAVKPSA